MRLALILFLFGLAAVPAGATGSPLLNRAAEPWLGEVNRWAFTMQVRKLDGNGAVKEVRVERFDPSQPGPGRWELVSVDGRPPTEARRASWQKAKARRFLNTPKSLAEFLDLENARAVSATPQAVRYHLPMRSGHKWLLPLEQVVLTVMVNKATAAIERVEAALDAPVHVVLGLGSIVDVDFDLRLYPAAPPVRDAGPATARPAGRAHLVVGKLGERSEYTWSDLHRVTPAPEAGGDEKPAG